MMGLVSVPMLTPDPCFYTGHISIIGTERTSGPGIHVNVHLTHTIYLNIFSNRLPTSLHGNDIL